MTEIDSGDKVLLQRGLDKINAANEVMRFLSDYFRDKYGLGPQHQIQPDGTITTTSLPGLHGLSESERNGNESVDMRNMSSEVAVRSET